MGLLDTPPTSAGTAREQTISNGKRDTMAIGSDFWSAGQSTWWMHVARAPTSAYVPGGSSSTAVYFSLLHVQQSFGETQKSNQNYLRRVWRK